MSKTSKRTSKRATNPRNRMPLILGATAIVAIAAITAILTLNTSNRSALTTITVADLRQAHAEGDITLLDVREPWEYEQGHVEGAVLMPLIYDTAKQALDAGLDKDEPVYVFCRTGNRSTVASQALVDAGFTDVRNVAGGIVDWVAAGYPVVN